MPSEQQVRESLDTVMLPGVIRSLVAMNLVREIEVSGKAVKISLASAALDDTAQEWVKARAKSAVEKLDGVNDVNIEFVEAKPAELNQIKHVIAVMSGKGGVGKSLVSSLMAVALRRQDHEVGILDADITGSSIARMFGIIARPSGSESGILPVVSRSGIELMSMNLLLPNEESAVIWRGPLLSQAITQFWEDVLWGRLDYLIVDLPPGTADAPLTVLQKVPVSGVVIVFTPQELTAMIVRKAVDMANKMDKPVIGVVENMSYLYVAEIDRKIELFGRSKGEEMAQAVQAPLLASLPVDPELAKMCDDGDIERYDSDIMSSFAESLRRSVAPEV